MKYVLIVLFAVAMFLCCADDIYVDPPMDIPGDYTGIFRVDFPPDSTFEMEITWTFGLQSDFYYDYVDGDDQICDGNNGEYTLESSQLIVDTVEADLGRTCNTSWMPYGKFGMLLESKLQKITLTKDSTYNDVRRVTTVILNKVADE